MTNQHTDPNQPLIRFMVMHSAADATWHPQFSG
jgi:hypothetical protein